MILYEEDILMLTKICDFINDNLDKDLRTNAITVKFSIDKYKLRRHFQQHFQKPLHRYILEQRMNKAMELLSRSKLPVFETAKAVGYEDKSAFSHAFVRHFGISPASAIKLSKQT